MATSLATVPEEYLLGNKAMYLFAYGLVLLVGMAYLIAPHKLRLTGTRDGLFPRAQEGDRLDVEVKLTASRRVSTIVLEEELEQAVTQPADSVVEDEVSAFRNRRELRG